MANGTSPEKLGPKPKARTRRTQAGKQQEILGFFSSLLVLAPFIVLLPSLAIYKYYALPTPLDAPFNPITGAAQISETNILADVRVLSEDIGFRTVGTREHMLGDVWLWEKVNEFKKRCDEVVNTVQTQNGGKGTLECEIWRQEGSGSHRFDILQARLYKTYVNLSNIVVRVSDGTEEGKQHAVLVNSHLDSTIPSPGAADDAISVGVMMEVLRVLLENHARDGWTPKWALIFLFNNAEESLQDGSHMFSTQFPLANTVRAAINLEACGTTGPELLFQATSEQMIEAYSHVPRPHGTVIANEIFSSGIIMSDTDFRQFELYLNVTGLDMAIVGHSYFYHTRSDTVDNIQAGVAQHMAENTLALVLYLTSDKSPLPTLTTGYVPPSTVFFCFLNEVMVMFSFKTALRLYSALVLASVWFVARTRFGGVAAGGASVKEQEKAAGSSKATTNGVSHTNGVAKPASSKAPMSTTKTEVTSLLNGVFTVSLSFVGSILSANLVALFMRYGLNKSLSWYRAETSCALLYGPAALTGALAAHLLFSPGSKLHERTLLTSVQLAQATIAWVLQFAGLGSGVTFAFSGAGVLVALVADHVLGGFSNKTSRGGERPLWLGSYVISQFFPLLFGAELFVAVVDFFVPLTGRMGEAAPAENIIATTVALIASYVFPAIIPFTQRFGRAFVVRSLYVSAMATVAMVGIFAFQQPFDRMHPKRVYIVHGENVTTSEVSLHIAACDSAPGLLSIAEGIASFVVEDSALVPSGNVRAAELMDMNPYNGDWDAIYPFSAFLTPYKLELDPLVKPSALGSTFSVSAVNETFNARDGTRSLTILITHPGLIWTVIAFDAHVVSWSLDSNPPPSRLRHHVKEASFYGTDTWSVDLVIKDPDAEGLKVNFIGMKETTMWPGKKGEREKDSEVMSLFEKLDGWFEERWNGQVDVMFVGCVGGIVVI